MQESTAVSGPHPGKVTSSTFRLDYIFLYFIPYSMCFWNLHQWEYLWGLWCRKLQWETWTRHSVQTALRTSQLGPKGQTLLVCVVSPEDQKEEYFHCATVFQFQSSWRRYCHFFQFLTNKQGCETPWHWKHSVTGIHHPGTFGLIWQQTDKVNIAIISLIS